MPKLLLMGVHDSFQRSFAMTATHKTNCTAFHAPVRHYRVELRSELLGGEDGKPGVLAGTFTLAP